MLYHTCKLIQNLLALTIKTILRILDRNWLNTGNI